MIVALEVTKNHRCEKCSPNGEIIPQPRLALRVSYLGCSGISWVCRGFAMLPPVGASWAPRALDGSAEDLPQLMPHSLHHVDCTK